MKQCVVTQNSQQAADRHPLQPSGIPFRRLSSTHNATTLKLTLALFAIGVFASSPSSTNAQASAEVAGSPGSTVVASTPLDLTYIRPTARTEARNYVFDAFGPYPIVGSAIAAGVNQESNAPPEWKQGVEGYSKRFSSDFGTAVVGTTTRYALAAAFKEDTLYYRCDCSGTFPRLRHAMIATLTARRGQDGHRVFSFPALVAPYAGAITATYAWYPSRYGAKDAFRNGNYSLLLYMGSNIGLEFFYSGPHSLLSRMHLNNQHGAPGPGPNH